VEINALWYNALRLLAHAVPACTAGTYLRRPGDGSRAPDRQRDHTRIETRV